MRDFDIPNVLKVKNPGPETFSLAGLFSLPPGKVTDVHLGKLHDSHRAAAYSSVLNSIAGGVIEFVSGPENFKLPTSVANAISRREKIDADGIVDAQRKAEALANRPDGTPTLPTIKPPSQQPVIAVSVPPASNPVGSESDEAFVPPPPPTVASQLPPPPPPAPTPAPVETTPAAVEPSPAPTPDSDSAPASAISDL
ncbi:MAG: hypothetical protein WC869_00365 [Phycisphaerae bacterium]|jgi:hypothetical protein